MPIFQLISKGPFAHSAPPWSKAPQANANCPNDLRRVLLGYRHFQNALIQFHVHCICIQRAVGQKNRTLECTIGPFLTKKVQSGRRSFCLLPLRSRVPSLREPGNKDVIALGEVAAKALEAFLDRYPKRGLQSERSVASGALP